MPEQSRKLVTSLIFIIVGVTMVYSFVHLLLVIAMLVYCTVIFTISTEIINLRMVRVLQVTFVIAGLHNLTEFGVSAIAYSCTLMAFILFSLYMEKDRVDRGTVYLGMICVAAVVIKHVRWYYYLVPIICGMTNASAVAGLLVRYDFE